MSDRFMWSVINYFCLLWFIILMSVILIHQSIFHFWLGIAMYIIPSCVLSIGGYLGTEGSPPREKIIAVLYGFIYISEGVIYCIFNIFADIADWKATPKPRHKNFRY